MKSSRIICRSIFASISCPAKAPRPPSKLGVQQHWLVLICNLIFAVSVPALHAQQFQGDVPRPGAGSNWEQVKALPVSAKVHISTDRGGTTCRLFKVTNDTLTCARGANAAGTVFQRPEIRHIKLAHYGRSTLVGAAIGGGTGATVGAIGGRTKPCPSSQGFCLNGIGIGTGGVAAISGVAGGLLGSVVGGVFDITRGNSIYIRP